MHADTLWDLFKEVASILGIFPEGCSNIFCFTVEFIFLDIVFILLNMIFSNLFCFVCLFSCTKTGEKAPCGFELVYLSSVQVVVNFG